jgi:hypothetical protein
MTEERGSTRAGARDARPRTRAGGQASGGDRMAELEVRLAKLERAPGLRERGRGLMARVIPDEAAHHFRNAGREELLGIRSIVDFWIDRIDDAENRSGSRTRRESIEIE